MPEIVYFHPAGFMVDKCMFGCRYFINGLHWFNEFECIV